MLAAARAGSNRAWAALLERVDPECRRLAHLVLGGHDVDATLLSAYVRAYRARRKGPPDAVVFLTHHVWIACGHELRRQSRREAPAPGRRPVRTDRQPRFGTDALGRAIAGLRPEERAVWGLIDQAGLPVAAVAQALGVDPRVVTTVATRVARTLDTALAIPVGEGGDDLAPATGDLPEIDHPGEDTEAVMATEASTSAAPAVDRAVEPIPAAAADAAPAGSTDVTGPDESGDEDEFDDEAPGHDDEGRLVEGAQDDAEAEDDGLDGAPEDGDVEPPAATPAFWNELGQRLRAEREAPRAAPPPPLPEPGDPPPSLAPAKAPPVAMQKRAPAKSRKRRPDVVEELAGEVDRQRPRRHWGALLVRALAVVLVVGVIGAGVFVLYRAASDARSPVRGETVAEAAAHSMEVLQTADTWSATIERRALADAGMERAHVQMVTSSDGSFRIQDDTLGRITTFDNSAGTLQDTLTGFPPRNEAGVGFGAPDSGPPRDGTPLDDLGIAARALASVDDSEPVADELNGRGVKLLSGPLGDDIELTYAIDAREYTPVRITWSVDDTVVRELRFADVDLAALAPEYRQDVPGVAAQDMGFARVKITEAESRTQLAPLTPEFLPEGFTLSPPLLSAVDEGDRITAVRYTRGPQEIIVTVRPSPVEAGQPWDDPFARPEDRPVSPTDVAIEQGPFRGTTAQMVAGPRDLPSIWGADGTIAFTVSGDLSAEDLVAVATSLRAR